MPASAISSVSLSARLEHRFKRPRLLFGLVAVIAAIAAWGPKSADAHVAYWGSMECQSGAVQVQAPITDYQDIEHWNAWITGLYYYTDQGWSGPYWNDWALKPDFGTTWSWRGQQVGGVLIGVLPGYYYAMFNYVYDYWDGTYGGGWSYTNGGSYYCQA